MQGRDMPLTTKIHAEQEDAGGFTPQEPSDLLEFVEQLWAIMRPKDVSLLNEVAVKMTFMARPA